MSTSQNGWSAGPGMILRPLIVGGTAFVPGIRHDDEVHTVLGYVATQFHTRVEPLRNPGCWGYAFRENRNDPNALSNHASGTALDINALRYPRGTDNMTADKKRQVRAMVTRINRAAGETLIIHGGVWSGAYRDQMHYELAPGTNAADVDRAVQRLRSAVTVDLSDVVRAAESGGHVRYGRRIKRALAAEVGHGQMSLSTTQLGRRFRNRYKLWQTSLGYSKADADGVPGKSSLTRLGARHGFTVKA